MLQASQRRSVLSNPSPQGQDICTALGLRQSLRLLSTHTVLHTITQDSIPQQTAYIILSLCLEI